MTMTDTEAKALAWATQWETKFVTPYPPGRKAALVQIFTEQLQAQEAAEARHAAELRELKERFSEVAKDADEKLELEGYSVGCDARKGLRSFILPAPDPLVEAIKDLSWDETTAAEEWASDLRAAMQARGYEWRKIGEAGE